MDTNQSMNKFLKEFENNKPSLVAKGLETSDKSKFVKTYFGSEGDKLLQINFGHHLVNDHVFKALIDLAKDRGVEQEIKRMFSGEKMNETEKRAVLHVALRAQPDEVVSEDGNNVMPEVGQVLDKIRTFSDDLISGKWKGFNGDKITDVVNIGIGGSDLGPLMVTEALQNYRAKQAPNVHFVSNVDRSHFDVVVKNLNPKTTLFIICSKTFTTMETMSNGELARKWILDDFKTNNPDNVVAKHFVAVTANVAEAGNFGIPPANIFKSWDWVGGRYSLWGAVGLSIACLIGYVNFEQLLAGARYVDNRFRQDKLEDNIPVIMALLGILYTNGFGAASHAVIPYTQLLHRFPAYLQQLEMESNGKSTTLNGQRVAYMTAPVIWGEPGTNAQHSFFQMIHQGTHVIPCDFIGFKRILPAVPGDAESTDHDLKLLANCIGQAKSLWEGKTQENRHRNFEGKKPSTLLLLKQLSPFTLGMLVALYEHKVFVQGIIWGINSFDQFGVELGKENAKLLQPEFDKRKDECTSFDFFINEAINFLKH